MKYEDFLPWVIPYVPGCPDVLAADHVKQAARSFSEDTGIWNYETAPVLTTAGVNVYALDLDQGQERVRLIGHATVDSCRYDVVDGILGRAMVRTKSYGRFMYLEGPYDLVVYPTPVTSGQEIVVQIAVKPAMTATDWPDDLAEYVTDIAQGAISSLCRLPKKEWSDRQQAIDARGMFEQSKSRVAIQVATGFTGRLRQIRHRI